MVCRVVLAVVALVLTWTCSAESASCSASKWSYSAKDNLVCVSDRSGDAIFGVARLPKSATTRHQEYAIFLKYTNGRQPSALSIMYIDGNYAGPICDGFDGCSIEDDMVMFVLSNYQDAALLLGLKTMDNLRIEDDTRAYRFTLKGSSAAIAKLMQ